MHKLRNETKNPQVRNVLDEVTCRLDRSTDGEHARDYERKPGHQVIHHTLDDNGQPNSINYDDVMYDENLDQQQDASSSFVISSESSKNHIKHLLNIPPDQLPCQLVKFPTGAPNTALQTPNYKEMELLSGSGSKATLSILGLVLIFIHFA